MLMPSDGFLVSIGGWGSLRHVHVDDGRVAIEVARSACSDCHICRRRINYVKKALGGRQHGVERRNEGMYWVLPYNGPANSSCVACFLEEALALSIRPLRSCPISGASPIPASRTLRVLPGLFAQHPYALELNGHVVYVNGADGSCSGSDVDTDYLVLYLDETILENHLEAILQLLALLELKRPPVKVFILAPIEDKGIVQHVFDLSHLDGEVLSCPRERLPGLLDALIEQFLQTGDVKIGTDRD